MMHKKYRPWKPIFDNFQAFEKKQPTQDTHRTEHDELLFQNPHTNHQELNSNLESGEILFGGISLNKHASFQSESSHSTTSKKITEHARNILAEMEATLKKAEQAENSKFEADRIRLAYEEKVQQALNKLHHLEQAKAQESKARKVAEHKTKYILEQVGMAEHARIEALEQKTNLEKSCKTLETSLQLLKQEKNDLITDRNLLAKEIAGYQTSIKNLENEIALLSNSLDEQQEKIDFQNKLEEELQANIKHQTHITEKTQEELFKEKELNSDLIKKNNHLTEELREVTQKTQALENQKNLLEEKINFLTISNNFLENEQSKLSKKLKEAFYEIKNLTFSLQEFDNLKKEHLTLIEQFTEVTNFYNADKTTLEYKELEIKRLINIEKSYQNLKHEFYLAQETNCELNQRIVFLEEENEKKIVAENIALDSLRKIENLEKILSGEQALRNTMEARLQAMNEQLQEAQMAKQLEENMRKICEQRAEEAASQTGKAFLQFMSSQKPI